MQYRLLGNSGLRVSVLGLGTTGWGAQCAVRPRAMLHEACADAVRVLSGDPPHHGASAYDKQRYDGTIATS